jgi:hypothetical protein
VLGNLSRTRLIDGVPHARLSYRTNRPAAQPYRAPTLSALSGPNEPGRHCTRPNRLRAPHFRVPQV